MKAAVVGGGLAGLTAAIDLMDAGVDVEHIPSFFAMLRPRIRGPRDAAVA